jgi:hypothetical protein
VLGKINVQQPGRIGQLAIDFPPSSLKKWTTIEPLESFPMMQRSQKRLRYDLYRSRISGNENLHGLLRVETLLKKNRIEKGCRKERERHGGWNSTSSAYEVRDSLDVGSSILSYHIPWEKG